MKTFIWLMQETPQILGNIVENTSQEEATTWRDGGDGWTVVEVLCHLRDFDGFFRGRAEMMLAQDHPELPAYDHDALVIERNYNAQDLRQVYQELVESRNKTVELFENLSEDDWQKIGVHPERGHFTMEAAVMQVGLHDTDHIEQITRIIAKKQTTTQ